MTVLHACLDCGIPTTSSRCPSCRAKHERARGTRQSRGIDRFYDRARELILAPATHCAVCGEPFTEDNPKTLGHIIPRRAGGTNQMANLRAECRRCNYGHVSDRREP